MICKKCGKKLERGEEICKNCGTPRDSLSGSAGFRRPIVADEQGVPSPTGNNQNTGASSDVQARQRGFPAPGMGGGSYDYGKYEEAHMGGTTTVLGSGTTELFRDGTTASDSISNQEFSGIPGISNMPDQMRSLIAENRKLKKQRLVLGIVAGILLAALVVVLILGQGGKKPERMDEKSILSLQDSTVSTGTDSSVVESSETEKSSTQNVSSGGGIDTDSNFNPTESADANGRSDSSADSDGAANANGRSDSSADSDGAAGIDGRSDSSADSDGAAGMDGRSDSSADSDGAAGADGKTDNLDDSDGVVDSSSTTSSTAYSVNED